MLAIRMQRIGRRGHAHFRVFVQDSRQSPKSGKFVALLGSYDPHSKATSLVKDKAQTYLNNGAQPSDRVAQLFKSEGVKLPKWVSVPDKKAGKIRNQEKLRRNRSETAEPTPKVEATAEAEPVTEPELPTEQKATEAPADAAPTDTADQPAEVPADNPPSEEPA